MNGVYYNEIISKLDRFIKREQALQFTTGFWKTLLISSSVFFFFTVLEWMFHFSSTVRTVLFFIFIISLLAPFLYWVILPLSRYFYIAWKPDYYRTAGRIGSGFPDIKDELYNAMQLVSTGNERSAYSPSLIQAAFYQVYGRVKDIPFEEIVCFEKARKLFFWAVGTMLFCIITIGIISPLSAAAGRLLHFNTNFVPPSKFTFVVVPGNARVTKGDNVLISFKVIGVDPKSTALYTKQNDKTDFEQQKITKDSTGTYTYEVNAVQNSFSYYVQAEDVTSGQFQIEVSDRPVIKRFDIIVTPPAYSRMPQITQQDNGNITSLIGSTVEINVSASKRVNKAFLRFTDTTEIPLNINAYTASGRFRIKGDNSYQVILKDENGDTNAMPVKYDIKALYDAYPTIEVINPPGNTNLANDSRVPAFLRIADDYGFSRLLIKYRLSESKYQKISEEFTSIEIPISHASKEQEVNYIWNLTKMNLAADDIVSFYFEVFDNDNISGPKSVKSNMLTVRVPSLDEILTRADQTQKTAGNDLNETLKQAEELKKEIQKIDQDLKKNQKDLSWEEKEKLQKTVDNFKQLQEKVQKISSDMQKMQQELQENNLLSKETMQKYMELQKLMDNLTSDEMKKAMERLQDVLKTMNRQQAQEQLQNMKIDEEQFRNSIERTMNLLKRIQVEQKMDELVKRTEDIIKKQDELNQQTQNSNLNNQQEKQNLANQQEKQKEEMDKLRDEMKDLADKMQDLKDMPKDQADKLQQDFDKQQNQQLSEESMQNLMQNQKQMAQQKMGQISKNMRQMQQQMKQMQQQMAQQNQMKTFADMMKMLDNLVNLSKEQEQLKNETKSLNPGSSQMDKNSEQQNNLEKALERLMQQIGQLSQKTFAITPEMGKALGDAKRNMERSQQEMQNSNPFGASRSQDEAMGSLNQAALNMKSSMESMMQGGGQGGMMSLMQQLQKMSGMQMSLNNMMQQLQQGMQGQLTPQQQAQFQRLGQQQELIRKSLEQLNREARMSGDSKKIPSNLDNINQQMKEVVSDIQSEKLNPELLQKQERILSKLLDAQRSINERDYEKERESNSGKNMALTSPADLNFDQGKGKDKIKDELNRAVQEGYKKDYEDLIRKYFEALQKENVKK
jgi:hypothetical protein